MVTVAVLSADQRLSFQIHTWMKEVSDNVIWEIHGDVAAFAQKIQTEDAAEVVARSKTGGDDVLDAEDIGSGKSKAVTDAFYRLIIVDLDLLNLSAAQAIEWTQNLKTLLSDRGRSDQFFPVKVLFLAFEGGNFKVDDYRNSAVDDLILKPLDRSVFLQKIEIMTSDDPGVKASFLFRQKTNITIEIGKDAVIDEISEFSLAIRNPAPLADGVYASIHCALLGPSDSSRVIGRVYKSEPHPTIEGQYLVSFGFFGLRSEQLTNIKKFVRDHQPFARPRAMPPPLSDLDPTVPFNRVAVVDMNADIFNEIQSAMKENYIGVQTTHYLSYARLLTTLKTFYPTGQLRAADVPASSAGAPAPAEPEVLDDTHGLRAWTSTGHLNLIILSTSLELVRFDTPLSSGDIVFGRTRLEWNGRPQEFFAGLDKQDAGEFLEMVGYTVSGGGMGRSYLKLKDQSRRLYYVEAQASVTKMGEGDEPWQLRIELTQIEKNDYIFQANRAGAVKITPADMMYDAIYIDVNLIRGDLRAWFDGLHEAYLKAGLVMPSTPMPKIILLADEKSRNHPEDYRNKIASDFLYKPLDRRMMSFKAKVVVNELIPRKEPDLPPFVRAELPARLAKDAVMEELSEYGLSIGHPTPFRKGAMVRFFSPLFGAGAEGVLARCTHCVQKEEKEVSYVCHFMFFGTPDENLKRIRNWIREDYVQRKEPAT